MIDPDDLSESVALIETAPATSGPVDDDVAPSTTCRRLVGHVTVQDEVDRLSGPDGVDLDGGR